MQLIIQCDGFIFPYLHDKSPDKTTIKPISAVGIDEFDDNPDLSGVYVDGFPLPATPTRPDDAQLQTALRRVPITPSLDQPLGSKRDLATSSQPLRVIIAGGGLGGLALASTLIHEGYDVHVFEQAEQYKPFGGPIQIQSNALWALREINPILYLAVEEVGVRTGDQLSGIKDGM